MNGNRMRGLLAVLALCLPVAAVAQQMGSGVVALAGPGAGASEDFDTLANAHNTLGSALPAGWYFVESGTNANDTYLVDDGSSQSGNTFSYGTQGSGDRALGVLASGSLTSTIGAQLRNDSGAALADLDISFFVEQWRLGTPGGADVLTFAYSANATSLTSGTWTPFTGLNAVAPVTAGTEGTRLDGNAAANRAQVSATLQGINLAPGASLWIRWSDINDGGVDDALAIDDIVFGTPVDIPPYLADSFPRNGDDDFPANASLILTFSEPVDVDGVWFEIQCDASGYYNPSHTTVSGGPTVYYLTPDTPFEADDDCELTLDTTLIVDQGSEGYELDDPGTIAFGTIAPPPNEAPELVSTVPLQGANNFPSAGDLRAVFNEPVTAATGAFTLTCDESTGIAPAASSGDGGITWVVATGTALVAGDACTFGIHRDFIADLEGALLDEGATIAFTVADFGNVGAYYENVNLASPGQMRCSLYETIKGHTAFPYSGSGTNTWTILNLADEDPVDPTKILDAYRNDSYTKITGGSGAYNREHTWPNTYGFSSGSPGAYTDTHMLYLTHVGYNSDRGSKPFGNCPGTCIERATTANHGQGGGGGGDSNWFNNVGSVERDRTFEVWDARKGDMARAVMYMAIRYKGESGEPDLELTDQRSLITSAGSGGKHYMGLLTDLLAWNQIDAPDARELGRNQIVQSFQNNRNPFIDHPGWARAELFAAARATPCRLNEHAPVAANDSYAVAQDATLSPNAADGVLENDTDVEFDAVGTVPAGWFTLTAERLANPANGTLSLSADGSFTYAPTTGFCGTDSFTYRTSDGVRWSTPATVTIAVGSDCETGSTDIFADGFEQD